MTVTKEEISQYLIDLRDSGVVNMWGAGAYLEHAFGMTRHEARDALIEWMESVKRVTP
jgi:hypothetical protein